jgi:hypothetical protein
MDFDASRAVRYPPPILLQQVVRRGEKLDDDLRSKWERIEKSPAPRGYKDFYQYLTTQRKLRKKLPGFVTNPSPEVKWAFFQDDFNTAWETGDIAQRVMRLIIGFARRRNKKHVYGVFIKIRKISDIGFDDVNVEKFLVRGLLTVF